MKYWERADIKDYRNIKKELEGEGFIFVCAKSADDEIKDFFETKSITFDFESVNDVDKLQDELWELDESDIDDEDIKKLCNTQMGIQFEDIVKEKYENM